MKILKKYIFLFLFSFAGIMNASENPLSLWDQANDLYKKGSYKDAAVLYDSLINSGYRSAALFFNLGNAFFKLKDYPTALLYFEKAKLYNPGDDVITYNLELTRTLTGDKIDAVEEFFVRRWLRNFIDVLSFEKWGLLSLTTFIGVLILAGLYLFSRKRSMKMIGFWMAAILMVVSVCSFIFASLQYRQMADSKTAIVMSPSVTVKSSPSETGNDLFVIHDGTKVSILERSGEWAEIRIANGNTGWLKAADYREI